MTTAHRTAYFGKEYLLGVGGKWVKVITTDRGPLAPEREFDISSGAAKELGMLKHGLAFLEVIELDDIYGDRNEQRHHAGKRTE